MKCYIIFFLGKSGNNVTNLSSAEMAHVVVKVNAYTSTTCDNSSLKLKPIHCG